MKLVFFLFSLYVLGTNGFSVSSRISNGNKAEDAPHACMVLVLRPDLANTNTAVLGSGSIVSARHVLTAAHVVQGRDNTFQINFMVGPSRRSYNSNFALIHENYDQKNFANDIALIFIQDGNTFPVNIIIPISTEVLQTGVECTVCGYGFTSVLTIGFASEYPHAASQRIANGCQFDNIEAAPSHVCAIDEMSNPQGIVCPGDNGAGLYTTTITNGTAVNALVGVASHILKGCSTAALTAYTQVSLFANWISAITGV
ncbi:Chymotrypsin-1 [Pseudolycoriella hygida]|uniref:Chymotrypsin-1 n=1 Tax=Pseudolycoriella hygida TaxID=35572 RepID=A0A9Q0RWM1_9DIPT|nr:Chymotrypsin-1 [Pseudolycoriella hygida]